MTGPRRERADAARNRRAILSAAERLLTELRAEQVTVERIAAEAGVGKGTVFHRFGSRMGLMVELMHERGAALSEEVVDGPPPLGPGVSDRERLLAFLDAMVSLVAGNVSLLAALDQEAAYRPHQGPRQEHPIYALWHAHVRSLIRRARPDLDADLMGHLLLGALRDGLIHEMVRDGEAHRLAAGLRTLATSLLDARPS